MTNPFEQAKAHPMDVSSLINSIIEMQKLTHSFSPRVDENLITPIIADSLQSYIKNAEAIGADASREVFYLRILRQDGFHKFYRTLSRY